MKVLLVRPTPPPSHWPRGSWRSRWVPTGLASIAAALLRDGHDVRVHIREEQLMKDNFNWAAADGRLKAILRDFRPGMVGLSVCSPSVAQTQAIAQWAKEAGGRTLTVAGGPHPTALPEHTLADCPAVDVVAVGEGEKTMLELAKGRVDESVAGIAFRRDGRIVRTAPRPVIADLDSIPPTPYELFDMAFYTAPSRYMVRWLDLKATNLRTSRGCTNRCRFCAGHVVAGVGMRLHSIDRVLGEFERAVGRLGVEAVLFEDDTFGADPARIMEICRRLRQGGLARKAKWACCLRVDQAAPELLAEMKSAGCIQVEYGFESGSDASLKRLGKAATAELNRRAVELTRRAGLRIFADIMVGLPGETEADFQATVDFLRWARPEVISATRLYPLPGTPIFDELDPKVRDAIDWGTYAYLDMPGFGINLTAMTDGRFDELYRRFRRYFTGPATTRAFLRDSTRASQQERHALRRKLRRFIIRHPIRALRAPW